jgi:hypothetical protein
MTPIRCSKTNKANANSIFFKNKYISMKYLSLVILYCPAEIKRYLTAKSNVTVVADVKDHSPILYIF